MFTILIVLAIYIVLLMLFGVVWMVLNERRQQHIQYERAEAYFAARDKRQARIEAAARESALSRIDKRAP